MEHAPAGSSQHTGLEIVSRVVKVLVNGIGGLIGLGTTIWGGYQVFLLSTLDKGVAWWDTRDPLVNSYTAVVVLAVLQIVVAALNWAILVPLNARIHGVNLYDPEVRGELRRRAIAMFVMQVISLVILAAVPTAISWVRFGRV